MIHPHTLNGRSGNGLAASAEKNGQKSSAFVPLSPNLCGNYIARIVIPRQNKRDILSIESFYRSLSGIHHKDGKYALEIHSHQASVEFVVRATSLALIQRIRYLIESHWPQSEVHLVGDENADGIVYNPPRSHYLGSARLYLREAAYLPILSPTTREGRSTYDDLQRGGDPMLSLIGALDEAKNLGVSCVLQYVPYALPSDWAKPWRGNSQDVGERMKFAPQNLINIILGTLGGAGLLIGLFFMLPLALLSMQLNMWLLFGVTVLISLGVLLARFARPFPSDPLIVTQKAISNGFRVGINIYVYGNVYHSVNEMLTRLTTAFTVYNMPSANGFCSTHLDSQTPDDFVVDHGRLGPAFYTLSMLFAGRSSPILSTIEMTTLWHLPHENAAFQSATYTTSRKMSSGATRFQDGTHEIGYVEDGSTRHPLRLSAGDLNGNIAIFAGTRTGKSNLMAWLAKIILDDDPNCSMIVLDPHQNLSRQIASLVPEHKLQKTIYWDLTDRSRCIGFNFLDRIKSVDNVADRRMDNMVNGMKEIWPDNWGPRMEDFLRHGLLTLLSANKLLVGEWLWRRWCYEFRRFITQHQEPLRRLSSIVVKDGQISLSSVIVHDAELAAFLMQVRAMTSRLFRLSPLTFEPSFEDEVSVEPSDGDIFQPSHPSSQRDLTTARQIAVTLQQPQMTAFEFLEKLAALKGMVNSAHLNPVQLSSWATGAQTDPATLAEYFFYSRITGDPPSILQYTLLDVSVLLNDFRLQQMLLHVLPPIEHQLLSTWWVNTYERLAASGGRFAEMVAPIITKINAFAASHVSSRVFGQSVSTIDLKQIINDGWVLIVNNAVGGIGEDTSALIGSSILNWCASILYSRTPEQTRRRVVFILDEFHIMSGANYEALLSELGKYGAQTILATQSLTFLQRHQRSGNKRYPVLENASTLVAFRCSAEDSRTLAQEFALGGGGEDPMKVTEGDIVGLPDYSCFMRLREPGHSPVVLRVRTFQSPPVDNDKVEALREDALRTYARPDHEISKEISISSRLSNISSTIGGTWQGDAGGQPPGGNRTNRSAIF